MLSQLLREGFQLAHRRIDRFLLDILWKFVWLVLTAAGFLGILVWFASEFRSIAWVDTGNRAINTAIAVRILREFWVDNWPAMLGSFGVTAVLSGILWFFLEAAFRSRFYSPPRRGGVDAPKAQTGWSVRPDPDFRRSDHPGLWPPLLGEEGNSSFRTFLLSNSLKCLCMASAAVAFGAVCFGRFFAIPVAEWPHLWPDARGGAFVSIAAIAALGFLLTILDTLLRSDALVLLGTDLFRVTGLVTILLSFEAMIVAACAMALAAGLLNVAGLKSALGMLTAIFVAIGFLNVLHSYLLLVRYSAVDIMRKNVVEV